MKNIGNSYSLQGMVILSILMIVGFLILYFTGCNNISNYNEFYNYLSKHCFELVASIFFILVGLYGWILYIKNVIIKPKNETLYLLDIDKNNICTFLNKKGKIFYSNNDNYEVNKFYEVLKTSDVIHKVLYVSSNPFNIPQKKEKYWLNFYCPIGNFENLLILPIVYVMFFPGLLGFLMISGFEKIFSFIFMLVPGYLILYDLIYKIKKKKNESVEPYDDIK